jgi:hypothetical protein
MRSARAKGLAYGPKGSGKGLEGPLFAYIINPLRIYNTPFKGGEWPSAAAIIAEGGY